MEPTEFGAWIAAITGGFAALAVALAKIMEILGLRPQDRRERHTKMIAELQGEVQTCETKIERLERELSEAEMNVILLERMLLRQGYRKGKDGWEVDR